MSVIHRYSGHLISIYLDGLWNWVLVKPLKNLVSFFVCLSETQMCQFGDCGLMQLGLRMEESELAKKVSQVRGWPQHIEESIIENPVHRGTRCLKAK